MGIHASFDSFAKEAFGLETGDLRASPLAAIGTAVSVERGRPAQFDRGSDQIIFVVAGATKLAASVSDDREQIVAFHFEGDVISIPANRIHSYHLAGLVDCRLLVFPAGKFFDIAAREPSIARALFTILPAALHRCRDKAVSLGRKNATERLAGFLVAMAERIGRPDAGAWLLDLPMSRRDISDSLGLTIETVSRQLSLLRGAGLVETQGRSVIVIKDIDKLTACAGHCEN